MTDKLRCFIAIDLNQTVRQQIVTLIDKLKRDASSKVRWVDPDNLHITLRFLGDVAPTHVGELVKQVEEQTRSCQPFKLTINTVHPFPSEQHPKIVVMQLTPLGGIEGLASAIEEAVVECGFEAEQRRFNGHITLARLNHAKYPVFAPELTQVSYQLLVKEFYLYQSELQPEGAVHKKLHRFCLSPGEAQKL